MSQEAARFLWWGLSSKTRKTYATPTKSYTSFCAMRGIRPPFPATNSSLMEWVAHLGNKWVKTKTIKAYLTGLRSAHIDMGFEEDLDAFYSPSLQRIIAGIRRLRGEAGTQERRPITKDLLLQMLPHFNRRTKAGSTMYAAFCLAFAAFLRVGQFTYSARDLEDLDFAEWFLTRRSVRLYEDHLELTLPASKNNPFTLTIAASDDAACPVQALRHLFRWGSSSDSPLFQLDGAFTRETVTSQLRKILTLLGVEGHYSGHSYRRGAATSSREAGLTNEEIQLLGHCK